MDLKNLQEQFLQAVTSKDFPEGIRDSMLPGGKLNEEGCLMAYRNDYVARLSQTLADNFESLWTVLGDKEFFELCAEYITSHPSKLYDLGEYGKSFPSFLKDHETDYLSELAELEIEFRRLFNAAPIDGLKAEDFQTLEDPSSVVFEMTLNLYLSSSKYPLYKIWELRGNNSKEAFDALNWIEENFLMFNSQGTVEVVFLTKYQHKILSYLCSAKSLGEAIHESGEGNEQEVTELFSTLVSNSLILNYS
jgi:hypothetical protein